MFNERMNPTTTAKLLASSRPGVVVSSTALDKMQVYTEECSDEIGWLGTVYYNKNNNIFQIKDVFLFKQDVHATTTEITPEGLQDFAEELINKEEEGVETWNNLKMWGHSHVNMGVTPSGQDDKQMETFQEGGHDFFIRLIANKKGDLKIDVYNYETGIIYIDVPWIEEQEKDVLKIQEEINKLETMISELEEERMKQRKSEIVPEIKEKVKKKSYAKHTHYSNYYKNHAKVSHYKKPGLEPNTAHINDYPELDDYKGIPNVFKDDEDIEYYLDDKDMVEISFCNSMKEVDIYLYDQGYNNYFTDQDVLRIMRVARKYKQS